MVVLVGLAHAEVAAVCCHVPKCRNRMVTCRWRKISTQEQFREGSLFVICLESVANAEDME